MNQLQAWITTWLDPQLALAGAITRSLDKYALSIGVEHRALPAQLIANK